MYVQVPAVEIQIIVLWSDEKSAGTASVLKRSAVKKGTISVGVKVSVEDIQCAVNIDDSAFVSPRKRKTTTAEEDSMQMDLGSAASSLAKTTVPK